MKFFLGRPVWLACLLAMAHQSYGKADTLEGHRATDDVDDQSDIIRRKRADDDSPASLQATLQQQASVVQQLQADMTALKNELSVLRQSQPSSFSPVAFSVRFSQDNQAGLPMSSHATLIFDHAITNIGNAYDVHTGIFTAPVAGVYCFYFSFLSALAHGHTYIDIVKDGDFLDNAFANGGDDYDQGSTEVVVHLVAGDQVWVRHNSGTAVRGGSFTIFTGHLVQAD